MIDTACNTVGDSGNWLVYNKSARQMQPHQQSSRQQSETVEYYRGIPHSTSANSAHREQKQGAAMSNAKKNPGFHNAWWRNDRTPFKATTTK